MRFKRIHYILLLITVISYGQNPIPLDIYDYDYTINDSIQIYASNNKLLDGTYKIGYKDNSTTWNKDYTITTFKKGIKNGIETQYYNGKIERRTMYDNGLELYRYELSRNYADMPNKRSDSTYFDKNKEDRFYYDFDGNLALRMLEDRLNDQSIRTTYYDTGEIAIIDYSTLSTYSQDSIYHFHKNKQVLKKAYFNQSKKTGVENWYTENGDNWLKLVHSEDKLKHGQLIRNGKVYTFQIESDWPENIMYNTSVEIKEGLYINPVTGYFSDLDEFDIVRSGFAVDEFEVFLRFTNYAKNRLDGEKFFMNVKGELVSSAFFKDDIANGPFELYKNGRLIFKAAYKNGSLAEEGCFTSDDNDETCKYKYLEENNIKVDNHQYTFQNEKLDGRYIVNIAFGSFFDDEDILNLYKLMYPEFGILSEYTTTVSDVYNQSMHLDVNFKNGQKTDKQRIYRTHALLGFSPHETISESLFKNGKKEGLSYVLFDDTRIEIPYVDGKKEGIVKFYEVVRGFNENDEDDFSDRLEVICEFPFTNNMLNGVAKYYNNDHLEKTETYKNNQLDGLTTIHKKYYTDSSLELINYKNGKKHGPYEYSENDQLVKKCSYSNGLLDGKYQEFENGKVIYEITYKEGVIID
ncbi:toxin-antitoxin system YwqK family antitoxin [Winogradskyella tangerina]|uniref:toxin-antitoxin system YwqK family antitoxin n=1 Tax=Winogradskyella tangerina TaxID=2023240 RepID=UPI000DBE7590|nr:hypothetical protein [Winogradskyella tangerina]